MKIWIIGYFKEYFDAFSSCGVIGKALRKERGQAPEINFVSVLDHLPTGHKDADDSPYGGGAGMVLRADILKDVLYRGVIIPGDYGDNWKEKLHLIHPSPRGEYWNQNKAEQLLNHKKDLVYICGRYEGIDERFLEAYIDEYISLGPFILSGAEIAIMAMLDSALRLSPGVLGNEQSFQDESYQNDLLEYAHYTKPREFEGKKVPDILLSGHHEKIKKYRQDSKLELTKKFRPDLLKDILKQ